MLIVHHLDASRSFRLLVLLEELALPYEVRPYRRTPGGFAPASLRAVHPLGKAPILTDGDRVLVETGAIFEYLVDRHGGGRLRPPPGSDEEIPYRQFLHYAEGSLMPLLLASLLFSEVPKRSPRLLRPLTRAISGRAHAGFMTPQLALHLGFLENHLADRPWFAGGQFTAADVAMSYPLAAIRARGRVRPGPRVGDWLDRFDARPSRARAEAAGGRLEFL